MSTALKFLNQGPNNTQKIMPGDPTQIQNYVKDNTNNVLEL